LSVPKESPSGPVARDPERVVRASPRTGFFGIDFWHAVEFSRSGRAPIRAFRLVLGATVRIYPGGWRVSNRLRSLPPRTTLTSTTEVAVRVTRGWGHPGTGHPTVSVTPCRATWRRICGAQREHKSPGQPLVHLPRRCDDARRVALSGSRPRLRRAHPGFQPALTAPRGGGHPALVLPVPPSLATLRAARAGGACPPRVDHPPSAKAVAGHPLGRGGVRCR
jgi:hypothetical protein